MLILKKGKKKVSKNTLDSSGKDNISSKNNSKRRKLESASGPENRKQTNLLSFQLNPYIEISSLKTTWNFTNKNSYENIKLASDLSPSQSYNANIYHKNTSLYFVYTFQGKTYLITKDIETSIENTKLLKTESRLNLGECIVQLPNGELFCFGKIRPVNGFACIIQKNDKVRILSPGKSCFNSSAIYLNNSVYCFGGLDCNYIEMKLSYKFDLSQNRWIKLSPMPEAMFSCSCIIFKENILISGIKSNFLWLYSVDLDSFSRIDYEFAEWASKILINSEEKLYVIENSRGWVYESQNEYSWIKIKKSDFPDIPRQISWAYNKGEVYIGYAYFYEKLNKRKYYKFNIATSVLSLLEE